MNKILPQIVADIFAKTQAGQDPAPGLQRLKDELKKMLEGEDAIYEKFRGLVESFREIIPEERQRHNAAVQALSTTTKLSRQEILTLVDKQLELLRAIEKILLPANAAWRGQLKATDARLQDTKNEIAQLRQRLAVLEEQERAIVSNMTAQEKQVEPLEQAVKQIFTAIGTEIIFLKQKVQESSTPAAAPQPSPMPAAAQPAPPAAVVPPAVAPAPLPAAADTASPAPPAAAPLEAPPLPAAVQADPPLEPGLGDHSLPVQPQSRKKCPNCVAQMNFQKDWNSWMCYSCGYQEQGKDPAPAQFRQVALEVNSTEPSAPEDSGAHKKCPMCGGRMDAQAGGAWMCYSCAYEESETGETQAAPGAPSAPEPAAEPDQSPAAQEEPIKSAPIKKQPTKKKPCPGCGKKMNLYEEDRMWRCPHCEYERRI